LPDSKGRFQGQGWTRKREEAWDRIFARHEREKALYDHLAEGPKTVALPDKAQELLERGFNAGARP
jgi:hypothetical protein